MKSLTRVGEIFTSTIPLYILPIFVLPIIHHCLGVYIKSNLEMHDKTIYFIYLSYVAIVCFFIRYDYFVFMKKIVPQSVVFLIYYIGSLVCASTVTSIAGIENVFWFGYGINIIVESVLICPFLIFVIYNNNKTLHLILSVFTFCYVVPLYILSIFQPPWAVIDFMHTAYVVNEVLAPQNFMFPLIDFMSQYTFLYGYVFNFLFSSSGTSDDAIWFLTILAILALCLSLIPLLKNYPHKKRYLLILFVIPGILIVKNSEDIYSGSLGILFSAIPIRTIFPAITSMLLSSKINLKFFSPLLLGFVCSLGVLNNFESGIVNTIAAMIVLALIDRSFLVARKIMIFLMAFVTTLGICCLILQYSFGQVNLSLLFTFAGGFGKGFGSHPMPSYGLWTFIFSILLMSIIVSFIYLHYSSYQDSDAWRASIISIFWGLIGIGMLPYYINRSIVSGQLQLIMYYAFLSSAGAIRVALSIFPMRSFKNFAMIAILMPATISISSLSQCPSWNINIDRIKYNNFNLYSKKFEFTRNTLKKTIQTASLLYPEQNIAFFLGFSNIVSIRNINYSYLPFNDYGDMGIINDIDGKICKYLHLKKCDTVFVDKPSSQLVTSLSLCRFIQKSTQNEFSLYIRNDP